ncbi:MAG TPA: tetratricopeptide repeat protein, partial [Chitinispirillaceae bacterium]|nr:tetratricopeptide repeat protein [Chitinispirillaceae bacterium]
MNSRIILLLSVVVLLAGCAAQVKQLENEALLPEIDVVQVKENSDQALKLSQEIKLDVEALNTKLTENDNKLTMLADEVSSVSTAKIEEIENRISLLIEAIKDMQAQIKGMEAMALRAPKTSTSSPDPTFSPSAQILGSPEIDLYNMGLRAFNSRNYKDAIKIFTDLLTKFSSGEYADNAHFWIGESFYSLGEFTSAIKSYEKVLTFKSSSKADDAQFKLGVTYNRMGQQTLAKQEFDKLVSRYPVSEYVSRARKMLGE